MKSSLKTILSIAFPIIVAMALFATSSTIFFPGFMSFDSFSQYSQVLGDRPMTNAHPAVLVYIWRALLILGGTPGVFLVFDQAVFWTSITIFSFVMFRSTLLRTVAVIVVGTWPPIFIISLHLWKDTAMIGGLALAVAGLSAHAHWRHKGWLAVSAIGLFYATAVRYNAITGVIPLVALLSWRLSKPIKAAARAGLSCLVGFAIVISFSIGIRLMNIGVIDIPQLGTIWTWDLSAISLDKNKDVIPSYMPRKVPGDILPRLRATFSAEANYKGYDVVSPYPPAEDVSRYNRDWAKIIFNNLGSYLSHRVHVFLTLLSIGSGPIYYPFHPGIDENKYGVQFWFNSFVRQTAIPYFDYLATLAVYRVWPYFLIDVVIFLAISIIALKGRANHPLAALAIATTLSGLLLELPLLIFAPAADYRYSIWLVLSAVLSLFMCVSIGVRAIACEAENCLLSRKTTSKNRYRSISPHS